MAERLVLNCEQADKKPVIRSKIMNLRGNEMSGRITKMVFTNVFLLYLSKPKTAIWSITYRR